MTDTSCTQTCSLDQNALEARKELYRRLLMPRLLRSERTANELQLVFAANETTRAEIEAFIGLERQCCGFLTFDVVDDPSNVELVLSIAGDNDALRLFEPAR